MLKKLAKAFKTPDNKTLSKVANFILYVGGPSGTFVIYLLCALKIIEPSHQSDLIASWASFVGVFKLMTKFSSDKSASHDLK